MYAVIETGSKQYRVSAGDILEIERLSVEAGQSFTFERVLLVGNDHRQGDSRGGCGKKHPRTKGGGVQVEAPKGISQEDRSSAGVVGGEDQGN
jgi:ribosomal protein L21